MLLTTKYICNHFEVGRLATLLPGSAAFLLFTRVQVVKVPRLRALRSRGHNNHNNNILVHVQYYFS